MGIVSEKMRNIPEMKISHGCIENKKNSIEGLRFVFLVVYIRKFSFQVSVKIQKKQAFF
jgi:hypothetical protein